MSQIMPTAYIPSPPRGAWHLGAIPVRAYALCIVAGILIGIWLAARRYRAAGGRAGLILDVAAWAVPFGLVGAWLYSVLTDFQIYFGGHRDWTMLRVWNGGIPGAIALGAVGAWIACRRAGVPLPPVAGAAAPAIAIGQAIGRLGNWFDQELYGRPSNLPWAVEISPAHRVPGYESFATFQPAFLYECVWDLLVAAAVIWAARRFLLTGDRTFALYLAAYSIGMFGIQVIRIDYAPDVFGLRVNDWVALIVFVLAVIYLFFTHPAHSDDDPGTEVTPSPPPKATTDPSADLITPTPHQPPTATDLASHQTQAPTAPPAAAPTTEAVPEPASAPQPTATPATEPAAGALAPARVADAAFAADGATREPASDNGAG